MKYKTMKALIIAALLLSTVDAFGQQTSEIDQLKATIQKLEAVARDDSTPSEVKEINHRFLVQRRAQLQALLQKKIKALQSYQSKVGSSLSAEENGVIEVSIQELKSDLSKLEVDMHSDSFPVSQPGATDSTNATSRSDVQPPAPTTRVSISASPAQPAAPVPTSAAVQPPALSTQASAPPACELYKRNPKTFSLVDQYVCNLAESVKQRKAGDPSISLAPDSLAGLLLGRDFTRLLIIIDAKKGRAAEFVTAEESRVDKQVGGGSSNSGSTSLVTKGNVPAILGFAVENGALVEDTSGTTITFRGNPVGIAKALASQGLIGGFDLDDATTRFLRKFSFGFSFDTSRGQDAGVFTGKKQQLSEISARAVLYDKRDPRRGEYKRDWEDFLANSALGFLNSTTILRDELLTTKLPKLTWKDPALISWFDETQRALAAASPPDVEAVLIKRLNELPLDKLSPDTTNALAEFERQFMIYLRDRNAILKKVGKAGVLTFDYTDVRNVNQPDLSNFKFIGEKGFYHGRLDLTGNGSISMFNTKPAVVNIGRLRDAHAAFQLDGTFGSAEKTGVFVLSFAYKYQHLAENAFTQAGTIVPNTKGNISVGQLKLTVPIKGLGIKFPISVTFANRTELIKEKEVRGNFGFTFDLDTIFAKFKPF